MPATREGLRPDTLNRLREAVEATSVREMALQGKSQEEIARSVLESQNFTAAERAIARVVLRRHGLVRQAV